MDNFIYNTSNISNTNKKENITNIDKQKINKMIINSECYESYPCQHKVSFDNGFIYNMYNGKDIKKFICQYNELNTIKHHLTLHFEEY
jgi:hypothetical protein